jgi:hypothetical protein
MEGRYSECLHLRQDASPRGACITLQSGATGPTPVPGTRARPELPAYPATSVAVACRNIPTCLEDSYPKHLQVCLSSRLETNPEAAPTPAPFWTVRRHLAIKIQPAMASHNFGVIEVASRKTTSAPGWAYVPDTGANLAAAALQPSNRKRARNQASLISGADLTARQETKVRKDLEALDRDTSRDVNIAIPSSRPGPATARGTLLHTVPYLSKASTDRSRPISHQQKHAQYQKDHPVAEDVREPSRRLQCSRSDTRRC